MAGAKGKPAKPIIKADTPYKFSAIPELTKEKSDIILGLLISLLEPVGRYRAAQPVKSSSKKSKKRKRTPGIAPDVIPDVKTALPEPEISRAIAVGLNSATRLLEATAALARPESLPGPRDEEKNAEKTSEKRLAVLFLPKPKDDLVYAHLPVLCYTASIAHKDQAPVRLVVLDTSSERKIAAALGLPRAGVVGIMDNAPGSVALLDYVSENVAPVEIPWLKQALSGKWMGISVESQIPGQT